MTFPLSNDPRVLALGSEMPRNNEREWFRSRHVTRILRRAGVIEK